MNNVLSKLPWDGSKTYLLAILGAIVAIAGYSYGQIGVAELTEAIFLALGAAGIRHGIAKVE